MTTHLDILTDCGYHDGLCTGAEHRAAEILAGTKASNANVVLALHALECHVARGVHDYSHAAADTDRVRVAEREGRADERAVKRVVRREGRALDAMLESDPAHELLRRLRELARSRGLTGEANGLYSVRFLANQIRAARGLRSVMDRHANGTGGMAAGVPAEHQRLKAALAERHITV